MPEHCQWQHGAIPDGGLDLNAQPLVVAFSVWLWVLDNGQTVLDAEGIAQTPDGFGAAPKVAELPVTIQIDSTPNNVLIAKLFEYESE